MVKFSHDAGKFHTSTWRARSVQSDHQILAAAIAPGFDAAPIMYSLQEPKKGDVEHIEEFMRAPHTNSIHATHKC
jgi:hypothetical protein